MTDIIQNLHKAYGLVILDKYEDLSKLTYRIAGNTPLFLIDSPEFYRTRKVDKQTQKLIINQKIWAVKDAQIGRLVVLKNDWRVFRDAMRWFGLTWSRQISIQSMSQWSVKRSLNYQADINQRKLRKIQRAAHLVKDASTAFDYFAIDGQKMSSESDFKTMRKRILNNTVDWDVIEEQFKAIEELPYVEKIIYHGGGFDIALAENTISFEGCDYHMPSMALRWIMDSHGNYAGHSLSPLRYTAHPHVGSGRVCMGQWQDSIRELFRSKRYLDAVTAMWGWKNHYNQRDPYHRIYSFKTV